MRFLHYIQLTNVTEISVQVIYLWKAGLSPYVIFLLYTLRKRSGFYKMEPREVTTARQYESS